MRIAVAQLMNKYICAMRVWNVPRDKTTLKKKIKKFEVKHIRRVKSLQKRDKNRAVVNMQKQ